MKPLIHARSSANKYGGTWQDYMDNHDFMDSSKATIADVRHRAIFHSAFGCFVVEKVFGSVRTNSDGKQYSTRDIAEDHIMQDLGFIPSVDQWLRNMSIQKWMGGPSKGIKEDKARHIPLDDVEPVKSATMVFDTPSRSGFVLSPEVSVTEKDG